MQVRLNAFELKFTARHGRFFSKNKQFLSHFYILKKW